MGVIEGLGLSHFMEPAVSIRGGQWRLARCEVSASRRGAARASTAVDMRAGTSLYMVGCSMRQAVHAVRVERDCTLEASECTFLNNKEVRDPEASNRMSPRDEGANEPR